MSTGRARRGGGGIEGKSDEGIFIVVACVGLALQVVGMCVAQGMEKT